MVSLLLAAFLALPATAQDTNIGATYRDFSGGNVDLFDASQLQPNQSPDSMNLVTDDPQGSAKPRNGFIQCGITPSGNPATGLYEYFKNDGTRNLIVSDNSSVWTTRDCITFTNIRFGLSSTAQVRFATVRNKLWGVNGSTWAFVWDGVSVSTLDARASTPSPAPPRCKYIEFWKERVWCANAPGDTSGVAYSALFDNSGNDLDPSTGTATWPAVNVFEIDQDGGSPIYGIKAYRDKLFVFKNNGIWQIVFNTDFDNAVIKTLSSVGTRFQESIHELDNLLYFVGPDGIYAFDGEKSTRISETIPNKFATLNQPLVNNQYKQYSSQADWNTGSFSSTTANDIVGSVTLSSQPASITNGDFESGMTNWKCQKVATSYQTVCSTFSAGAGDISPIQGVYSSSLTVLCGGTPSSQHLDIFNVAGTTVTTVPSGNWASASAGVSTMTVDLSAYSGQSVFLHFWMRNSDGNNTADLYSSSFTVRSVLTFQYQSKSCGSNEGFSAIDNIQNFQYRANGNWTGPVFNAVSVSTWSTFDANTNTNGGSVVYAVRLGTDTTSTYMASYSAILPGATINGTTSQIYIQVTSSLTATADQKYTPELQDIALNYAQGGNNTQLIYAASYKNRLWISASSGSATTDNIVFVKSKAPSFAWNYYDLQVGPIAKFNDIFYAGASTHSALYRLDYGTNDNGKPITWYWTSRDEIWGDPNHKKYLNEITTKFRKGTALNSELGYSSDSGLTFSTSTLNMSGTGYGSDRKFINGGISHLYRFRVKNSTLDEKATLIDLTGWAKIGTLRE